MPRDYDPSFERDISEFIDELNAKFIGENALRELDHLEPEDVFLIYDAVNFDRTQVDAMVTAGRSHMEKERVAYRFNRVGTGGYDAATQFSINLKEAMANAAITATPGTAIEDIHDDTFFMAFSELARSLPAHMQVGDMTDAPDIDTNDTLFFHPVKSGTLGTQSESSESNSQKIARQPGLA